MLSALLSGANIILAAASTAPRCCSIIELRLVISSCKPLNAQEKPPSVIVVSCNKHEYKTIADAAKRRLVLLTVYMQVLAVNRERCAPGTPCSAGPDRGLFDVGRGRGLEVRNVVGMRARLSEGRCYRSLEADADDSAPAVALSGSSRLKHRIRTVNRLA